MNANFHRKDDVKLLKKKKKKIGKVPRICTLAQFYYFLMNDDLGFLFGLMAPNKAAS